MAETTEARIVWREGLRFRAIAGSGPEVMTESPSLEDRQAPSPVELLLMGVAGCTAIDVVAILRKMREPVTGLEVEAVAQRAPDHPRYFTAVELVVKVTGDSVSREKVERAVELSKTTYCSVGATLRPDCPITHRIEIANEELAVSSR